MGIIRRLDVLLRADTAALRRDFKGARGQIKKFGRDASKIAKQVGKATAVLGGAALGKFALDAVRDMATFTSAMSDLSAITGATGKDLQFLADESKRFGRTTTLSASQAAEAFKLVASAKPDLLENGKALSLVTAEAVTLAEATGSDLPDAARILGSSLNQFQADATEAGRFINVLAAGSKFGASAVEDTAAAIQKAGVQASLAGASFEELNGLVQTLAFNDLKAEEAGTALRNVFIELEKSADVNLRPSLVGVNQAFVNLAAKNLTAVELVDLFGKRSAAAGQILVREAGNLQGFTDKLTGTNTAAEQAATKVDNLEGDVKKLKSAYEGLTIEVGEKLEPTLRTTVGTATDIANAFRIAATKAGEVEDAFRPLNFLMVQSAYFVFKLKGEFADLGDLIGGEFALQWYKLKNPFAIFRADTRATIQSMKDLRAETRAAREKSFDEFFESVSFGSYVAAEEAARERAKAFAAALKDAGDNADQTDKDAEALAELARAAELARIEAAELAETLAEAAGKELIDYNAALTDAANALTRYSREAATVLTDDPAALQFEQTIDAITAIAEKYPQLADEATRVAQAMAAAFEKEMREVAGSSEESFDEVSEFAKQAARNAQDAFAEFLFDPFGDSLADMLKNFINTLRRMAANAASQAILSSIPGIGKFFGARALGGSVSKGRGYLVGERGPELFIPTASSGTIVPNNKLGSGGGVNVTTNIDARGATVDLVKALPGILEENNRRVTASIYDAMNRGLTPA